MTHVPTLVTLAIVGALAAGRETPRQTETAIGTGAGAATGAVIGAMAGGGRGAAIGAGVGGGLGAAAGYNWGAIKDKLGIATKGSGVQVSQQQDGALKVNVPAPCHLQAAAHRLNRSSIPPSTKSRPR